MSENRSAESGRPPLSDALLLEAAERFGTPTYLYDLTLVTRRVSALRAAFPGARLHYAVKANANGALLRHLRKLGVGAEALTLGELERCLHAGFNASDILLGGPGHTPALAARALEAGVSLISIDGPSTLSVWEEALGGAPGGSAPRLLVRVNPGFDPGTHEHLATAAATSKFGVRSGVAERVAERARRSGLLAGFHIHAGSTIMDGGVAARVVEALRPLYGRFAGLELVDFGGGFGVPNPPLREFAEQYLQFAEERSLTPLLEPGRYLVAEAGLLLTRVLHVKEGVRRHVIADAGMSDLLRPALYGAKHPVRLVGGERGEEERRGAKRTDLDGPLCENADRLASEVALPGAARGDLLAVLEAGAYGFAMSSNYASSLRPAEVVWDGSELRLARRREQPSDLWRLEEGVA